MARGRPKGYSGKYRHPETNEPISVKEWRKLTHYQSNKDLLQVYLIKLQDLTGISKAQAEQMAIEGIKLLINRKITAK